MRRQKLAARPYILTEVNSVGKGAIFVEIYNVIVSIQGYANNIIIRIVC